MDTFSGSPASRNTKSDVEAKRAYCDYLLEQGFREATILGAPADIEATKDGVRWLFEVKFTRAPLHYFGAATLVEWVAAAADPEHFRFVVAYQRGDTWNFDEWTPEEFMAMSYVPPYKIFFNVPVGGAKKPGGSQLSKSIRLTKERLRTMTRHFEELRNVER